jgi:hypothetical protein
MEGTMVRPLNAHGAGESGKGGLNAQKCRHQNRRALEESLHSAFKKA